MVTLLQFILIIWINTSGGVTESDTSLMPLIISHCTGKHMYQSMLGGSLYTVMDVYRWWFVSLRDCF